MTDKVKITKITISGQEYTVDEARQLYEELHILFGVAAPVYIPQPYPVETWPDWKPIITWDTTAVGREQSFSGTIIKG